MNHNENPQNQNGEQNQQSHPSQPGNPIPPQPNYAPTDNTKLFSILAYIPLLWLVGLLADRGNPKVMYHVNQGILFNIAAVILSIAVNVISIILTAVSYTHQMCIRDRCRAQYRICYGADVFRHRQPLSQPQTHDYHNKLETVRAEKPA